MISPILNLKDKFKGKTVYVVGSGASLDYYDPEFFKDKIVLGCDLIFQRIPVTYTLGQHRKMLDYVGDTKMVIAEADESENNKNPNVIETPHEYWTHKVGEYCQFENNLQLIGSDEYLCSGNTGAISIIHLAAYMGAKTIILVAFDSCMVNGNIYCKGYAHPDFDGARERGIIEQLRQYFNDFFLRNVKEITILKEKLKEVYGCDVVSLSPFVGLKNSQVILSDYLLAKDMVRFVGRGF
jgi:hypothetical protein